MNDVCIRAGKRAYEIILDGGFDFDRVTTYFAPATGPRWLVASGFDLTLLTNGLLGCAKATHLVGSSAGALRFAAWLQPEPEKSYRTLMESYITTTYTRTDTPATVQASLIGIVNSYIEDDALPFALANKKYRFAIITARAKNLVASESKWVQQFGLGIGFLLNAIKRSYIHYFAERVVFYNGPKPPPFCLRPGFRGRFIPLNQVNFKYALVPASETSTGRLWECTVTAVSSIIISPTTMQRQMMTSCCSSIIRKELYRDGWIKNCPTASRGRMILLMS